MPSVFATGLPIGGTAPSTVPGASGSGVDARHPLYVEFVVDWQTMRDTWRGERVVKERGTLYLPPTSGMVADGMENGDQPGWKAYDAYRKRASFPDVVKEAVSGNIGVMDHKPPVIELPAALEPMRERATLRGESLEMLLRRINEEQLVTGRLGLLLDIPEVDFGTDVLPYVAVYKAEHVINWDEGRRDGITVDNLNFVSLDEGQFERQDNFSWDFERKFRVLILGDADTNQPKGQGVYSAAVFRADDNGQFVESELVAPSIRGRTLEKIPFVFVNSKDVVPEPEEPPLLGLARRALTIYRGEADYRQSLFMQGQDTLVVMGATGGPDGQSEFRVGANATINLPINGDAKYIGVESEGLKEMREALENDKAMAAQTGGQLMDSVSRERESGDALRRRIGTRTASLNQIVRAGAFGLEQILKMAAEWVGANPDEVSVEPNMDFVDDQLEGRTLVDLATAKSLGVPLSARSIHNLMKKKDLTELDFEEELDEIAKEEPETPGSADPNGPEPDEDDNDVVPTDEN